MIRNQLAFKAFAVLVIASILSGCGGGALPPEVPTIDSQATFAVVQTQAAQTVVAGLTLNAPTATPVTPSPTVTSTETPAPPTATPTLALPTNTPTATFIPWTLTPSSTPTSSYECDIEEQSPAFNTVFKDDESFDGRWVVENTGDETWKATNTDVVYVSGTKFQENKDVVDLSSDVDEDEKVTIIVDMVAPDKAGTYSTAWAIRSGGSTVCMLYLTIKVED